MRRKTPADAVGNPKSQPRRAVTAVDIVDRVLDKGIVIDYRARVSIGGIDTLVTVDARYVVTSCATQLEYGEAIRAQVLRGRERPVSWGRSAPPPEE